MKCGIDIDGYGRSLLSLSLVPVNLMGHDVVEVLEGDKSIVVKIGSLDHVLDVLVVDVLSNILGDLLELQAGEFTLKLV